jgi:transcriptional regulator with XRE-family HTH domain
MHVVTGSQLREWRHRCGLSREESARLLSVTRATVSRWERDEWPIPEAVELAIQLDALPPDALRLLAKRQLGRLAV